MKSRWTIVTLLILGLMSLMAWTAGATPPGAEEDGDIVDDVILLNKLQPDYEYGDMYSPVEFTHMMHTMFAPDCTTCHHYFETHAIEGVIVEEDCNTCHHMDGEDFETPMSCSMCHPEEGFTEKYTHFACDLCHELDKSFEVRTIELEDGGFYNPPSLQGIYHQNCFECHAPKRINDAGVEELACDKCHIEDVEE